MIAAFSSAAPRVREALAPVNRGALGVLATFAALAAVGAVRLPGGYHGERGLNVLFGLCAVVWGLGLIARLGRPESRLGAAVQAVALIGALTFAGALAAASLALGGGAYLDPALAAADRAIVPFLDPEAMYRWCESHPELFRALCRVYTSLNWQPFAALALGVVYGNTRRIDTLAAAWAFGLALSILPFHFLPAQGVFAFHHFAEAGIGRQFAIHPGGNYPEVLDALRSGAMTRLSLDSVAGLVTIPSFHACAAVILTCAFWPYRLLRWPMLTLNAAMALAAVPVGSHYVIDILVGGCCGGLAYALATALCRQSPVSAGRPPLPLAETAIA